MFSTRIALFKNYNLPQNVIRMFFFVCAAGSRDGSMGLWEVTEEVLSQTDISMDPTQVPSYTHITHKALKDIPKEYTNPYNCKVRALAFNNNSKVIFNNIIIILFWAAGGNIFHF